MTWEQKLAALQALTEHTLQMRSPGDWYVGASIEIGGDGLLKGEYGNGDTPESAVCDHWDRLTNIQAHEYLVVSNPIDFAGNNRRSYHRWNGFMWTDAQAMRDRHVGKQTQAA
jgi:hypothetical protein